MCSRFLCLSCTFLNQIFLVFSNIFLFYIWKCRRICCRHFSVNFRIVVVAFLFFWIQFRFSSVTFAARIFPYFKLYVNDWHITLHSIRIIIWDWESYGCEWIEKCAQYIDVWKSFQKNLCTIVIKLIGFKKEKSEERLLFSIAFDGVWCKLISHIKIHDRNIFRM